MQPGNTDIPVWPLACLRWHQLSGPATPRCLYRRQASSHTEQVVLEGLRPARNSARLDAPHRARHLLVQTQLTPPSTRTACGSKKLGGAMPGMYWSDTNSRQRSANAATTRGSCVLLAVA